MVGILAAVKFNSLSFIPRCSTNMEQQQNLHLAQAFHETLYIYMVLKTAYPSIEAKRIQLV